MTVDFTFTPTTPRLFCGDLPNPRLPDQTCFLDPEQTRHARKVLRLGVGAIVQLLDGRGTCAEAQILGFEQGCTICRVTDRESVEPPTPTLTIATCVPKGPRADDMIDQLSQLGADRIIPMRADRSVVDPRSGKLEKFERRAQEASKQCGRFYLLRIEEPRGFDAVLHEQADVRLILHPGRHAVPELSRRLREAQHVIALVGPEGGFTENELSCAHAAGFEPWSLGDHILRIETAAAAATALLRYPR